MQRVSVIGLGYIGLPTAAIMANKGLHVVGVDVNENTCSIINQGKIHIVEPGLEELVKSAVGGGTLYATTKPESADVFVIAVPTPFIEGNKPDLTYVHKACQSIAPVLEQGNIVILESTSPVGTTDKMSVWLQTLRPDLLIAGAKGVEDSEVEIHVAYCPERVLPGKVIEELVANDRAIGGITSICSQKAAEFYKQFVDGECVKTSARTAEMAKLTENSFRDVNIAFANELSMICEKLDINVWELVELTNRHPRVNVLQPGCGVGGHCIAVDPWFIVDSAPELAKIIRTAREVNDYKPEWVMLMIEKAVLSFVSENPDKAINDVTIGCFGLAFKPNIDDLRESPAKRIVEMLSTKYSPSNIKVCEPNVTQMPSGLLLQRNVELLDLAEMEQCDIRVILVAHDEFKLSPLLNQKNSHTLNFAWK
jgi:UDP-N-acetyl-D-mannosaminuronic acid dehydrogenase